MEGRGAGRMSGRYWREEGMIKSGAYAGVVGKGVGDDGVQEEG